MSHMGNMGCLSSIASVSNPRQSDPNEFNPRESPLMNRPE